MPLTENCTSVLYESGNCTLNIEQEILVRLRSCDSIGRNKDTEFWKFFPKLKRIGGCTMRSYRLS